MIPFLCMAIAVHDVDDTYCRDQGNIRLAGIGAIELNGTMRPGQPGVPGDPYRQRRIMATRVIGAQIARDTRSVWGRLSFKAPVALRCEPVGRSYERIVAWCSRSDGQSINCLAIRANVAARWERFDPDARLANCGRKTR